jgi:hypothetical protein
MSFVASYHYDRRYVSTMMSVQRRKTSFQTHIVATLTRFSMHTSPLLLVTLNAVERIVFSLVSVRIDDVDLLLICIFESSRINEAHTTSRLADEAVCRTTIAYLVAVSFCLFSDRPAVPVNADDGPAGVSSCSKSFLLSDGACEALVGVC